MQLEFAGKRTGLERGAKGERETEQQRQLHRYADGLPELLTEN